MPFKLALRNVRRRAPTYIVYFVTVTLTAAFMLAANSVLFAEELSAYGDIIFDNSIVAIRATSVIVAFVVCFIVCHTTSWLLDRRSREFGTYLLLGMPKNKLLRLFAAENVIVCAISFAVGSALGVGLFYVLNAVVCAMMGDGMTPLAFSPWQLLIALCEWALIFLIAVAWSSRVLGKAGIGYLMRGGKGLRKKYTPRVNASLSVAGGVMTVASFAVMMIALAVQMFAGSGEPAVTAAVVVVTVFTMFAGVFLFYFGLRGLPLRKIMKRVPQPSKRAGAQPVYEYKDAAYDARTLVGSRGLARATDRNAMIMGLIAVLMTFALILTCFMSSLRYILTEAPSLGNYDIEAYWDEYDLEYNDMTTDEFVEELEKYAEVETLIRYSLYDPGEEYYFSAISESDVNRVLEHYGKTGIDVKPGSFMWLNGGEHPWGDSEYLTVFGETLRFDSDVQVYFGDDQPFTSPVGYIVIDDAFAATEAVTSSLTWITLCADVRGGLSPEFYDAVDATGFYHYSSRLRHSDEIKAVMSSAMIASLFLGMTFTMMSMALLSLRITADAAGDRRRYAILSALGVSEKSRRRMLRGELLKFFAFPLIVPLLTTLPTLGICAMLSEQVTNVIHAGMFAVGLAMPLLYIAIFACYLGVTYYMSVITVLQPSRSGAYLLAEGDGK